MKKSSTIFLQTAVVFIGLGVLALLLWEPHIEGVNAQATTLREIYFDDPFLALMYIGSIPFFIGLYQTFKILSFVGQNKVFSQKAVKALRVIKYCALSIIGFVIIEEIFIMLTHGEDDAAGGIFIGVLVTLGSIIVITAATVFERLLQKAVDLKSENDLTV